MIPRSFEPLRYLRIVLTASVCWWEGFFEKQLATAVGEAISGLLDLILASDHSLPPVHSFPTEYEPPVHSFLIVYKPPVYFLPFSSSLLSLSTSCT